MLTVAVSSASASEIDSADFSSENSDGFILEESEISSTINDNGNMLSAESGDEVLIFADDNDNLTAAKSDVDVNLIGNSNDDEIIGASSSQSFSNLNALINGNDDYDIYLNSNYTYDSSTDYNYLYGIKITRSVYIHGNGYTIFGNYKNAKGFNVSAANVIFDNINFLYLGKDNGESIYTGAAIYSSASNTYVYNSNFTSCYGYFGGALSGVNAENCNFDYCMAGRGGIGAAMYRGSAKNCSFTNNTAYQGGAINAANADNCTFIDNYASQGGAVMNGKVTNCVFIRNSATYGGAIYFSSTRPDCINCIFIYNSASNIGGAYGGSINYLVNCTFENNSAPANSTAQGAYYVL